jgi:uncharacterized damage-inducible protein DinB
MSLPALLGFWRKVRGGLLQALAMLSDEQLAFVPREGLWSLGLVAWHIAHTEDGWFRYAVARELDQWPAGPSPADYADISSVAAALDRVHTHTEAVLGQMDPAGLDNRADIPWDEDITLREIIWHVIGHEIHHRGEIYLMLGLMGMEAPDV